MIRKIVKIEEEKCNGCGLCSTGCHEGALQIINGKARLLSDAYCDGLGACLPECPTGAITIEEREADGFDEELVKNHVAKIREQAKPVIPPCGCPGNNAKLIERKEVNGRPEMAISAQSQLRQWPCQIKLVPVNAPYFDNAHLLVAADCTAFAYANLHNDFMRNKITIIGCPKLDDCNYSDKLTDILKAHPIKSITVLRMEKPCCGGIVNAVKEALRNIDTIIPWHAVTIGTDGSILED